MQIGTNDIPDAIFHSFFSPSHTGWCLGLRSNVATIGKDKYFLSTVNQNFIWDMPLIATKIESGPNHNIKFQKTEFIVIFDAAYTQFAIGMIFIMVAYPTWK